MYYRASFAGEWRATTVGGSDGWRVDTSPYDLVPGAWARHVPLQRLRRHLHRDRQPNLGLTPNSTAPSISGILMTNPTIAVTEQIQTTNQDRCDCGSCFAFSYSSRLVFAVGGCDRCFPWELGRVSARCADRTPKHSVPTHSEMTAGKIAPWVAEHTANDQRTEFIGVLADQADLSGAAALTTKDGKGPLCI